jgi:hypothetical protein
MVTLTFGPFLTKTVQMLVTQKMGIKSVSASPLRRTYSLGQLVTLAVNFTRNPFRRAGEHYLRLK